MSITLPAGRITVKHGYLVETHGARGWTAYMTRPTLAGAERLALGFIPRGIPARILSSRTGRIVGAY